MPHETTHSERPARNVLDDKSTKTMYADNSYIVVNASDINIYFGVQPPIDGEDVPFENRIVLTHSSFMRMMEYWAPRYAALAQIYNGQPMSLHDFDQSLVQQALSDMVNPPEDGTISEEAEEHDH